MKTRIIILVVFMVASLGTAAIDRKPKTRELVESVATFVCPAKNGDVNGVIHLGKKGIKSAVIDKKNRDLRGSKERSLSFAPQARVVEGNSAKPILLTSKSSTWLALSQCNSSSGEFWFVGGTSDVTSLGYFQFTNENLGKAIIDIELWSEDGSESTRTLTIPARSTKNYSLTTFMPGKKLTAFNVISRSGLVSAYLLDERRRGLTNYGGDYVPPSTLPNRSVTIVGIPGPKFAKNSKINSQKIRLFVPGETDAVVQVTYLSTSGIFAPVGLDSIRVPAQKVVELELPKLPNDRLFTLQIRATEPVLASALTRGKFENRQELVWSSSVQENSGEKFALPERSGLLAIVTTEPKVSFTVITAGGKKSNVNVKVDSMAVWKVPVGARELRFTAGSRPKFLSFTMQSISGVASTPLAPAQSTQLTALPVVDSSLLIPGRG